MDFTNNQIERYSRHILLKEVGGIGQQKLLESRVLVIGAGGLGSPIATYLAAAGVGTIGIVDADVVDLSNLQRQILHHTADVGAMKVESAKATIESLNPDVKVELHPYLINAENVQEIIRDYDFILEGTDNFPTKFLVNDACILEDKAFNQGGILRFKGQTMTHVPGTASYRCVYRQPPPAGAVPTCSEAGVLGAIAGILGTIQAAEAIKYITGAGELLTDRILTFDALTMDFRTIPVKKTEWALPISRGGKSPENLIEYEQAACDL
jgi:molybdopterin/thiamine biosynthesis adenylyltransferase